MTKQSYAIIGTGALGGLYGGMLAKAGFDVHFLLHNDFEHVRRDGLKIESPRGDFHLARVNAYRDPDDLPPCDVTIVALKTTHNHLLPKLLPSCTREGGVVLVLQNGLDVEQDSAQIVGVDRTLGGCCFLCSNKAGPGHIKHLDYGQIVFGCFQRDAVPDDSPAAGRLQLIADEMTAAGIEVKTIDDLYERRWRKLMWNIPFNGLSVVLDASTREIIQDPDAASLAETIIREVHATANRLGVKIPESVIQKNIDATRSMVPYDSSMRVDYRLRRPMEIEAIFGNPVRAAQEHDIAMPRVEMLYRQLKSIDRKNRRD